MKNRNNKFSLLYFSVLLALCPLYISCNKEQIHQQATAYEQVYHDTVFLQEFHEAYKISENPADNEIRSIDVDRESNVWIATANGIFRKNAGASEWMPVITGEDRGPAYSVNVDNDGSVLMGTWNGLYILKDNHLLREEDVNPPVSVVYSDKYGNYAMGPNGIWHSIRNRWELQDWGIAQSVRDVISDAAGNLWIASDAGLYFRKDGKTNLLQDTTELISCNVKAVAFASDDKLWVGVLGGVSVRRENELLQNLTPKEGIPSVFVNCISQSPDGVMWVGTNVGIVRFAKDGSRSLRFSRRWLTDNKVNDVAFDNSGNAWLATANGVSAIKRRNITLADKQNYYYRQLMDKHIRDPWICGVLKLEVPGDTLTWRNSDDDNDGEYTGGYLAMESFRYAVTKDEDALIKARKAFSFLRLLHSVTETEAFFARTIVPVDWTEVHDPNRTYSERQIADALVKDPRYKPVQNRWRESKDGKWLWKGDTSSDEMCGHMMGYFFFYEYAADEDDKMAIREHVEKIINGLIENDYNLVDIDGKHTRWGVWSPEILNGNPDWSSEKSINSFELLAFLKFAAAITGNEKFEREYRRLIHEEGYLGNAIQLNNKNPAWQVYFDLTMEGYLFPIFLKYENDPELQRIYQNLAEEWMTKQTSGENLINNLTFALATGKQVNVEQTIEFLKDAPLDLVDWQIDHTLREDVRIVRQPILEEIQISELPAASERATVRWDKNPWSAVQGNPSQVREPVFWLWPYWMARYLGVIKNAEII